jgi:hypothetical protein
MRRYDKACIRALFGSAKIPQLAALKATRTNPQKMFMSPRVPTAPQGDIRAVWLTTLEGCLKTAALADRMYFREKLSAVTLQQV